MLKKIVLSGLVLTMFSLPLLAQQTTTSDTPTTNRIGKSRGVQQYQAGDPATRAQKMTDRLTQQLGLDQATSKKVYDVLLARAEKVDAIQKSSDDNKTKVQALKANADDVKSKMQSILTPDQYAKFDSIRGHKAKGQRGNNGDKDDQQ